MPQSTFDDLKHFFCTFNDIFSIIIFPAAYKNESRSYEINQKLISRNIKEHSINIIEKHLFVSWSARCSSTYYIVQLFCQKNY